MLRVFISASIISFGISGTAFAKHDCTDQELTSGIQSTVDEINSHNGGVCQSAVDGITLFKKSLALLSECKETPSIASARNAYTKSLQEAEAQSAGSCSQ